MTGVAAQKGEVMRFWTAVLVVLSVVAAAASGAGPERSSLVGERCAAELPEAGHALDGSAPTRGETLWIFDADFEDLAGDNAGWISFDRSGTPGSENYWHVDTIRTPLTRPYLGDHTWWCGTYAENDCWEQPRGYGNRWVCCLERDFPEVDANTDPGDQLQLEWDQRYAIEKNYDYGYVDVSTDGGGNWTTLVSYTNHGFSGQPGTPTNWGDADGHPVLTMDAYAGELDLRLRFRFESDPSYSSYDMEDNSSHSVVDGAWQTDNVTWSKWEEGAGEYVSFWSDDCESGGDPSWEHQHHDPSGNTGVTFARYQYPYEITENHDLVCGGPPDGSWVMAAVDPATSRMVNDEDALLKSPPIDVSGVDEAVVRWNFWYDCPNYTEDWFAFIGHNDDTADCLLDPWRFGTISGAWYGGANWAMREDDLDPMWLAGDWLSVGVLVFNDEPLGDPSQHMGGLFLDRVRIGIPTGIPAGRPEKLFHDWFDHELADAANDYAVVHFSGSPGPDVVQMDAPDLGSCYVAVETPPGSGDYRVEMPPAFLVPGAKNRYYFEAIDTSMNSVRCPPNAPDETFECSVLPCGGDILIVDKAGRRAPDENGEYTFESSYYYESALEILGYTWDRYDVPAFNGGNLSEVNGPEYEGLDRYETIFWVMGDRSDDIVTDSDCYELEEWLEGPPLGNGHDLMLAGNRLHDLSWYQLDILEYYTGALIDTDPMDDDATVHGQGSWIFPSGALLTGCPDVPSFTIVEPNLGMPEAEAVAIYETAGGSTHGAAVVNGDPNHGYQVSTLGFGIEYVGDETKSDREEGTVIRVGILEAALEAMEVEPSGPGTGIDDVAVRSGVSLARPNPFQPVTTIDYSVAAGGRTLVRVYDPAGRLVRTLLDQEVPAGARGRASWDGRDDRGRQCASGVYLCKVEAQGLEATRKLVLLR
jgi:hypothetical protein